MNGELLTANGILHGGATNESVNSVPAAEESDHRT
jgi:hypothetical protein